MKNGASNSSKGKSHEPSSPLRIWCGLFVVIQLTAWVRGAIVEQVREAAEGDLGDNKHHGNRHDDSMMTASYEGQDDPCSIFTSCK